MSLAPRHDDTASQSRTITVARYLNTAFSAPSLNSLSAWALSRGIPARTCSASRTKASVASSAIAAKAAFAPVSHRSVRRRPM